MDKASPARMYDYFLGGSHNFPIDRRAAEKVVSVYADMPLVMHANRGFLRRAVRYLVAQGIDQFLDIGSGILTAGSVHEIAHRENPASRVIYVDSDPIAVHHSSAVLKDDPSAAVIQADARQPDYILSHSDVGRLLDFNQPIGLLLVAVLPFIAEDHEAYATVRYLRAALPSGSYIVISHGTYEDAPQEVVVQAERLYATTTGPQASPPIAHAPNPISDTLSPDLPSIRYSISIPPSTWQSQEAGLMPLSGYRLHERCPNPRRLDYSAVTSNRRPVSTS